MSSHCSTRSISLGKRCFCALLIASLLMLEPGFPFYAAASEHATGSTPGAKVALELGAGSPSAGLRPLESIPELGRNQANTSGEIPSVLNPGTMFNSPLPADDLERNPLGQAQEMEAIAGSERADTGGPIEAKSLAGSRGFENSAPHKAQPVDIQTAVDKGNGEGASLGKALPLSQVRFFVARQGKPTISGTLDSLHEVLRNDPALASALTRTATTGSTARWSKIFRVYPVRMPINKKNPHGGLAKENAEQIAELLRSYGVETKVQVEKIPVDWQRHAERKAAQANAGTDIAADHPVRARGLLGLIAFPFRELAFLARTFSASITAPTASELVGAAVTKIPAFVIAVGVWRVTLGSAHPFLFALAVGLCFAQEAFHGVWLNTWNNLQNNLHKLRSGAYQTNFNWFYGMLNPAVFRIISHAANPADPDTAPPWTLKYWFAKNTSPWTLKFWFALGPISIVGTFIGTLAVRGLNALYANGRINRWQRSAIQQTRDLFMMVTGPLLGAGFAKGFAIVFLIQQAMDLGLYFVSLMAQQKPILYIADNGIAETKEFNDLYPVAPNPSYEHPVKQALRAILDIPLLFPVVMPVKFLYQHLREPKVSRP